jgi:type II secretory pathway pseudopilin PulG
MKPLRHCTRNAAFTLLELLIVIVVLFAALYVLVLPLLPRNERSRRSHCVNNLKQVALATKQYSLDYDGKFPWQVSTTNGGTLELAASPDVFRHFQVMSNYIESPAILACPNDRGRLRADHFSPRFANINVSYFIGLDADETRAQSILSGDRNLTGGATNGALRVFTSNSIPRWEEGAHATTGNLALSDGSVHVPASGPSLTEQFQIARQGQTSPVISLAMPRTPQDSRGYPPPPARFPLPGLFLGSILGGAAFVGAWLMIRRRLLARAAEPSQSS